VPPTVFQSNHEIRFGAHYSGVRVYEEDATIAQRFYSNFVHTYSDIFMNDFAVNRRRAVDAE